MKFYTYGDSSRPAIIMLSGSFCPAESLAYLYDRLKENYYIVVPEYNGHYAGSKNFTTRHGEAAEIKNYIRENNLLPELVYGQSMGAEIAIELVSQLHKDNVEVRHAVFDGAPCIKLSGVYKFSNGDTESLRPALESAKKISPCVTKESIRNETECCYTFDFPSFPAEFQKDMHFFYAREEKACKSCYKYVKSAYPKANYRIESGYGHLTYSIRNTDEYLAWLSDILGK